MSWRNLDNSARDAEILEAKGLAVHRWGSLLDLEAQVQRRPRPWPPGQRKRPSEPADKMLADEVIKRLEAAYASETDGFHVALEELTASAKQAPRSRSAGRRACVRRFPS
jgi:hypothetical protein